MQVWIRAKIRLPEAFGGGAGLPFAAVDDVQFAGMSESSRPMFSVITPSFRMLNWLKLCAASVADQHGVTFEHIVQDGGTGAELDEWARTQPSLRCFQERDQGMYDAINRGIKRATGDIFAYLNCDEQYLPGALMPGSAIFCRASSGGGSIWGCDSRGFDGVHPLSYRRAVRPGQQVHRETESSQYAQLRDFFPQECNRKRSSF